MMREITCCCSIGSSRRARVSSVDVYMVLGPQRECCHSPIQQIKSIRYKEPGFRGAFILNRD